MRFENIADIFHSYIVLLLVFCQFISWLEQTSKWCAIEDVENKLRKDTGSDADEQVRGNCYDDSDHKYHQLFCADLVSFIEFVRRSKPVSHGNE